jgi:hypothetical protein
MDKEKSTVLGAVKIEYGYCVSVSTEKEKSEKGGKTPRARSTWQQWHLR